MSLHLHEPVAEALSKIRAPTSQRKQTAA